MFDSVWQDTRYAIRQFRQNPAFAFVAIIVLAAGLAVNIVMFTLVESILLRPLRYEDSGRLVFAWVKNATRPGLTSPNLQEYRAWKESAQTLQDIRVSAHSSLIYLEGTEPEVIPTGLIEPGFISMLGVKPLIGRGFNPEEAEQGNNKVVILSYGFWMRVFGGDREVVGRTLRLREAFGGGDFSYQIVGVMPEDFRLPRSSELLFTPLVIPKDAHPVRRGYLPVARLRSDVSLEQAQAEAQSIAEPLFKDRRGDLRASGVVFGSLLEQTVRSFRPKLLLLWGAVGFVLLIACANLANLLLARSMGRQREFAVRAVLGAGRARLIRQTLIESSLLAAASGLAGFLLALAGIRLLPSIAPPVGYVPRLGEISFDGTILWFTFGLSILTALVFGLVPALQASRPDLGASLRTTSPFSSSKGKIVRNFLVVAEVALGTVLLAGAGLMVHSFYRLETLDLGYNPENLIALDVSLSRNKYPTPAARLSFFEELQESLTVLPGVESVSFAGGGFSLTSGGDLIALGEKKPERREDWHSSQRITCQPDYFKTLGVAFLRGRGFTESDGAETPLVAIINETMARRFWPQEDPLGKYFISLFSGDPRPRKVIGIVEDVIFDMYRWDRETQFYLPISQAKRIVYASTLIRFSGDSRPLIPLAKSRVWNVDPEVPLQRAATLESILQERRKPARFYLYLFVIFSGLALLIAAAGIYGVVSYMVGRRTQEIGIRMALGAQHGNILRMVLQQGMAPVLAGMGAGVLASYWLTRYMESFLFEVEPTDPATFAVVSLVLSAVALLACYVPARRATQVDPMEALRYE